MDATLAAGSAANEPWRFLLNRPNHPRQIDADRIDYDEVKQDACYRFVLAMRKLGKPVFADGAVALQSEPLLAQRCYGHAKLEARRRGYRLGQRREKRITSDPFKMIVGDGEEFIAIDDWETRAFDAIDEDFAGRYAERRANASDVERRACALFEEALQFVDNGLPVPGRIRMAVSRLRAEAPHLPLDLRLLAA